MSIVCLVCANLHVSDPRIKELFEMQEEDIDPQKLIIKDLILLAKLKEKKRVILLLFT